MIQRERLAKDFDAMAQLTAPGEGIAQLLPMQIGRGVNILLIV